MYIHTVKATAIAFSVYHHDVLLHSKGSSNSNDAILIRSYIHSLQYRELARKSCANVHLCLLGLFLNIKKYSPSCGMYSELQSDSAYNGILKALCGKIHIQSVTEMPVHRTWIIDLSNKFIVNTTVMKIDIPYETLNCANNHLHIYDSRAEMKYIAKLCGSAFEKIFYSNTSSVHIEFLLKYANHDRETMLSIVYQVHSKLRIQATVLHDKQEAPGNKWYNVQTLLIKTDNARIDIYYYNTYIWNQMSIVAQNINCSEERALIYDGPSRKSKLLGEIQQTRAETYGFISSLSIISIYFINSFPKCFNISASTVRRPTTGQLVGISATETMSLKCHYKMQTENIFKQIQIQAPLGEFINIKMSRFVYTGNTEAGCYLGGIVILPADYIEALPGPYSFSASLPPIGPLCGEVGRLIFEDSRLDGLTLGSHKADIIIFLYSGQISRLELNIIFSSDKCEGIPNVLDFPETNNIRMLDDTETDNMLDYEEPDNIDTLWFIHSGKYATVNKYSKDNGISLNLVQGDTRACVKMQNFIDSVFSKSFTSVASWTGILSDTFPNIYSADIKMACYERDCIPDPFGQIYNFTIASSYCEAEMFIQLFPPYVTFATQSFLVPNSLYCEIGTVHDTACAKIYDRVSVMTFQVMGGRVHCSNMEMDMNNNDPLLHIPHVLGATSDNCSSSAFVISDGLYGKEIFWYTSFLLKIQVSISPALHYCTAREIYVILYRTHPRYVDTGSVGVTYIWKMGQNMFEWTIWDRAYDKIVHRDSKDYFYKSIELYIVVKSHTNMTLYPHLSSCNQTMHIKYHHEKFPYDITTINSIKYMITLRGMWKGRRNIYCLLSTCYFLYWKMNVSWNSAQIFCLQHNMQLLTTNSDIKAQFIQVIL